MPRLPQIGGDDGNWGTILNDYLGQVHNTDGTLKDNIVTSNALAPNAVDTTVIQDGTISEIKLDTALQTKVNAAAGDPPVGGALSGTASNAQIVANAVTTTKVADGAITEAKLDNAAQIKLNAAGSGDPTVGGDLSGTASNAQIAAGVVTATELSASAVTNTKIADGAVSAAKLDAGLTSTISSKADTTNTYTKIQVDTALTGKANTAHTHTLDSLSDVTASGATNGQSLVYNAGTWGPADVGTGGTVVDATSSVKGVVQLSGDLAGTAAIPVVAGLQGTPVSATAPSNGQVLTYNGASAVWSTGGGGATSYNVITKNSNYTAQVSDFILLDMSGGGITITAPAPVNGGEFSLKKIDASNFNVTLTGSNIDGYMVSWSFPVTDRGISQDFISDGTNWYLT